MESIQSRRVTLYCNVADRYCKDIFCRFKGVKSRFQLFLSFDLFFSSCSSSLLKDRFILIDDVVNSVMVLRQFLVMTAALISVPCLNHIRHLFEDLAGLSCLLGKQLFPVFLNELYVYSLLFVSPLASLKMLNRWWWNYMIGKIVVFLRILPISRKYIPLKRWKASSLSSLLVSAVSFSETIHFWRSTELWQKNIKRLKRHIIEIWYRASMNKQNVPERNIFSYHFFPVLSEIFSYIMKIILLAIYLFC